MKTDDLVALLSTNLEPVDRKAVVRTLYAAIAAAAIAALGITFAGLGFRADLTTTRALIYLTIKLAFAIGIVGLAMTYLMRLARPGGDRRMSPFLIAVPFLIVLILAAISLGSAPPAHWERMIMGDEWLECLLSIPVIAIVPFAVSIWAVRKGAPTNLSRAGAFAGLGERLHGIVDRAGSLWVRAKPKTHRFASCPMALSAVADKLHYMRFDARKRGLQSLRRGVLNHRRLGK